MSKRTSSHQITKDMDHSVFRDREDPPVRATAAQMAQRKIKQAKRRPAGRSPAPQAGAFSSIMNPSQGPSQGPFNNIDPNVNNNPNGTAQTQQPAFGGFSFGQGQTNPFAIPPSNTSSSPPPQQQSSGQTKQKQSSFGIFGGSGGSGTAFQFSAPSSTPSLSQSNGHNNIATGFNGSIFNIPPAGNQSEPSSQPASVPSNPFASSMTPQAAQSAQPSSNIFGNLSTNKPSESTSNGLFGRVTFPPKEVQNNIFSPSSDAATQKTSNGEAAKTETPGKPFSFFGPAQPEAPTPSLFSRISQPNTLTSTFQVDTNVFAPSEPTASVSGSSASGALSQQPSTENSSSVLSTMIPKAPVSNMFGNITQGSSASAVGSDTTLKAPVSNIFGSVAQNSSAPAVDSNTTSQPAFTLGNAGNSTIPPSSTSPSKNDVPVTPRNLFPGLTISQESMSKPLVRPQDQSIFASKDGAVGTPVPFPGFTLSKDSSAKPTLTSQDSAPKNTTSLFQLPRSQPAEAGEIAQQPTFSFTPATSTMTTQQELPSPAKSAAPKTSEGVNGTPAAHKAILTPATKFASSASVSTPLSSKNVFAQLANTPKFELSSSANQISEPASKTPTAPTHSQTTMHTPAAAPAVTAQRAQPFVAKPVSGPSTQSAKGNPTLPSVSETSHTKQDTDESTLSKLKSLDQEFKRTITNLVNTSEIFSHVVKYFLAHKEISSGNPMFDYITGVKRKADNELDAVQLAKKIKQVSDAAESLLKSASSPPVSLHATPSLQPTTNVRSTGMKRKASENDSNEPSDRGNSPKRVREYEDPTPKVSKAVDAPVGGSQTSNLFRNILKQADHDRSVNGAATPAIFKPSFGEQASTHGASTFIATPSKPAASETQSNGNPFIFKPVLTGETQSNQSSIGFKPQGVSVGGTNFLAQFGQQAAKNAEKEKEKRKAEDFDSEEEDEAEWEKKDAEAQEAKKKELAEASRGKVAKFVPGQGFVFDDSTEESNSHVTDTSKPSASFGSSMTSNGNGASIFDSYKPFDPVKPSAQGNIFAHLSDVGSGAEGSKTGDADDEDTASGEESSSSVQNGNTQATQPVIDLTANDAAESSDEDSFQAALKFQREQAAKAKQNAAQLETPKTTSTGRSLFDRISKDEAGNAIRQSPAETNTQSSNSVGNGAIDSNSASGDHTWKADSPIKFGAESNNVSKPFAGLFGSPTNASVGASNTENKTVTSNIFNFAAAPASSNAGIGFSFGGPPKNAEGSSVLATPAFTSTATSRGTSPGATTDTTGENGATSETVDGEKAEDRQQLDLTSGGPGEEDEDAIFEVRAKALRFNPLTKQNESKGLGPLRVLKHRETGKVRMLLRQDPSGKVVINNGLIDRVNYEVKGPKVVSITVAEADGRFASYLMQVRQPEDATKLAEVLEANKKN